jgi:GNAT superfamily N-acetyltransferase
MPRAKARAPAKNSAITFHPLTPDRWPDLEALFGERGACGGCWCMTWRLTRTDFDANKGEKNKRAFKNLVQKRPPGILAYDDADAVGWCAIAPREDYLRPRNTSNWSITCLFVKKGYRRQRLSTALIEAASQWAKSQGATIIEAYPTEPGQDLPDPFIFTGVISSFTRAGFKEVKRPSKTRAIMRRKV